MTSSLAKHPDRVSEASGMPSRKGMISVLDKATRRLPEGIIHYQKVVVSLREVWFLPLRPSPFGYFADTFEKHTFRCPQITPSVLRTSPPNTTMEIQDAHSTVNSSDFGEIALWEFSIQSVLWLCIQ